MAILFETNDVRGFHVICTQEQWNDHVLAFHEDMVAREQDVKLAIENPNMGIYRQDEHPDRDIYYRLQPKSAALSYMKVIVEFKRGEGFLVTAFPTAKGKSGEKSDMTQLTSLIQSSQLKTNFLREMAKCKQQPSVKYDGEFDALFIAFKPNSEDRVEIVAYYVDDHVALLYASDSFEVVGLQIEDFRLSFLPAHENVARVWRLSKTGEKLGDMGDVIFYAQRMPKIAKEVAKATRESVGQPSAELISALEEAIAA